LRDVARPILLRALESELQPVYNAGIAGVAAADPDGSRWVQGLITLPDLGYRARVRAMHAVGQMQRPADSLMALLVGLARGPDSSLAEEAIASLAQVHDERAAPMLADLLVRGSAKDSKIVTYFAEHPNRVAVPGLLQALRGELGQQPQWRPEVVYALKASTGVDMGDDAGAWERWWREQNKDR
jgi:hypothetical protein